MLNRENFNRREFLKSTGVFGYLYGASETAAAFQQSNVKGRELLVGIDPSENLRPTAKRVLPNEARIVSENTTLNYVKAVLPESASATAKSQVTSRIASQEGVNYAEPNAVYKALFVPNDPRFDSQYAPKLVNAPQAWDVTLGDSDITIAVIDTGVKYNHPDLQSSFDETKGYDFVDNGDDPLPSGSADEHHGTHVAGIAAARTHNDTGIAGISNSTLLAVRALNENGSGYVSDISDGIQWATDSGADIINLSLGGGTNSDTFQRAVSYAYENGVLLVAAAGNDYGGPVSYPAAYDECIAVSALAPDGSLAPYSNVGSEIEIAAPGTNILSTWTDDSYAELSGTSMAAPIVSGIAALLLSREDFTNSEVRAQLRNTAVDIGLRPEEQGSGRVDASTATENDQTSTLEIKGTGSRSSYQFSTSGTIDPIQVNNHDTIRKNSAEGFVGSGTDSYALSGELVSLVLDGDAIVSLNGREISPTQYPNYFLEIVGNGSRSTYEFFSDGLVNSVQVNNHDTVRANGAEGFVGSGVDSYTLSKQIETFRLEGDADVRLNGEVIDPGQYLENLLTVEGTGSRSEYRFSVSGTVNPIQVNNHDAVRTDGAEGFVGSGTDSYAFSGNLREITVDGDATVRLNGEPIDSIQPTERVLTIEGAGSRTDYRFSVSGEVTPIQVNNHETIQASSAEGFVGSGADRYEITGSLDEFTLTGEASAELDRSANRIDVTGTGQRTDYRFAVSESVDPIQVNNHDTIKKNSAEGFVGSGTDSYAFSGLLQSFELGSTTVSLEHREDGSDPSFSLGIYSGLSDSDFGTIQHIEEWQNSEFDVQNFFVPWNPNEGHMNWLFDRVLPKIWKNSRVPLITWEPFTPNAQTASVNDQALVESREYRSYIESLADTTPDNIEVRIKNGEYDQYIDRWASRLKTWLAGPDGTLGTNDDRQAYIRLAHEMNGDWYPWAPAVGENSPSDYIEMWQHVRHRFELAGINEHVQWMWCANADDVGPYTAEQLYPGDAHVDWTAFTGYNWGESADWSRWESPESVFGDMLKRLRNLTEKPLCVAEVASTSETNSGYDPDQKDEWIRAVFDYFENQGVEMWCWFNEDKETDWAIFDGVRGTETVTYDGERLNAYAAFRESNTEAADSTKSLTSTLP